MGKFLITFALELAGAGVNDTTDIIRGFAFYGVFLFSTVLHEAAHAWAAKRGGDLTAYLGGQVSLDPRPHVRREPFGMVILPILSVFIFGWPLGYASAPYNLRWATQYPKRAAWMSLAGPGANLLLIIIAAVAIRFGVLSGIFSPPASVGFGEIVDANGPFGMLALFLGILFSMNLLLFVFNMLPLPPLDGSGAIPLLLGPEATKSYQTFIRQPMLSMIGMVVAWQLFSQVFYPLFLGSVNILYFPIAEYITN
jgi:Zn-dependent protease